MSPGVPHMGYTHFNIRFARASSNLSDFNCRNKALTAKLLKQGYRYFKFRKAFSNFIADIVPWYKNIASV